ncbi:uncharacterized protein LOC127804427 [Diospyros lotus]|uniref:uncharacterized protein LOC127804427 n=1 Tax=Diospyros lotus TaxID=55363 RepID=UPI0022524E04|nr:uncharacterized protein LOC127804427 [Diospyros lotus]
MLDSKKALLDNRFTKFEENAVQVAVAAGQETIVSELLAREANPEFLKEKNNYGETTLTLAVARGNMPIVEMLMNKYEDLVEVTNAQGQLPVVVAALHDHEEIVRYLYDCTLVENLFEEHKKDQSLSTGKKVKKVLLDLKEESNQAKEKHPINYDQLYQDNFEVLGVSINTKLHGYEQNYNFKLESKDLKPVSSILDDDEGTSNGYLSKHNGFMLFKACITAGIYDIALEVFKLGPDQCIEGMKKEKGLQVKRPETRLLANVLPDRDGNTLLHQAAKLSPSPQLSQFLGPTLQMQRELQRFKEVEKMAPKCKGLLNYKNQTPKDLFDKQHNDLKNQGRDWLKEIATSCSLVATLIVTIIYDILGDSYIAFQRRRFPNQVAAGFDVRPFHSFPLHCNDVGSFRYCPSHNVTRALCVDLYTTAYARKYSSQHLCNTACSDLLSRSPFDLPKPNTLRNYTSEYAEEEKTK